jgi:hypothetical protein
MSTTHNIGTKHFVQIIDFPVEWGYKLFVKGWTQEIVEPFRTSSPLIFKLPKHKALVVGKWTGIQPDEETALNRAIEGRILNDEDFQEGWTAPAYKATEKDFWATNV